MDILKRLNSIERRRTFTMGRYVCGVFGACERKRPWVAQTALSHLQYDKRCWN